MSVNHVPSDPSSRAELLSMAAPLKRPPTSGIDLYQSTSFNQVGMKDVGAETPSMSAVASRPPILPPPRHMLEDKRPLDLVPRPRPGLERIELPSIRQAVPEIQLRGRGADGSEYWTESVARSPTGRAGALGLTLISDYVQSPMENKRRKLSTDDDFGLGSRATVAPRVYRSPSRRISTGRLSSTAISPTTSRRASVLSTSESWTGSNRTSPYVPPQTLSGMRSPPFDPPKTTRSDWRPFLPRLPSLTLDQSGAAPSQGRDLFGDYSFDQARSGPHTHSQSTTTLEASPSYRPFGLNFGYQPPRGQSYPGSSSARTSFPGASKPHPGSAFPYGVEISEGGHDSKQRKRRGNLPKETTDKLRAWFVAHLQHPYPTEDEKQDLMRQTGLQMNQISNWFINARRRQLPAMINNARAESDARSAQVGEVLIQGDEGSDVRYDGEKRSSVPSGESDGAESGYEDDGEVEPEREIQRKIKPGSV